MRWWLAEHQQDIDCAGLIRQLGQLTDYIQSELLPRLATSVRMVIASRFPLGLAWSRNELWNKVIRPLRLEGFSASECRDYLRRRGLKEPRLVERVMSAAGNTRWLFRWRQNLALRFGVRRIRHRSGVALAVRAMVERLLDEVKDRDLRNLLEACLAFASSTKPIGGGQRSRRYQRSVWPLCQLSIVSQRSTADAP